MAKSNKQINKEADVSDVESTPAVVAYRVAQLELTQKEGFKALNDKLDSYVIGFVTEKEYTEAKLESKAEHERLQNQIDEIKKSARWWVGVLIALITAVGGILALVIK